MIAVWESCALSGFSVRRVAQLLVKRSRGVVELVVLIQRMRVLLNDEVVHHQCGMRGRFQRWRQPNAKPLTLGRHSSCGCAGLGSGVGGWGWGEADVA